MEWVIIYLAVYLGWAPDFSTNPYVAFDDTLKSRLLSKNIKQMTGIASLTEYKDGNAGLTILANVEIDVESNSGKITTANGELIYPKPNDDGEVTNYHINCAYYICRVYK